MLQEYHPKNKDLIVNINGELLHRDVAGVSPFDSAVQGGDAVWEGLRLYDGRIFKLDAHLARLEGSARALAFADIPSREEIKHELRRTLEANRMRDGVHVRLTLSRGVKYTSGMDPRLNTAGSTLIVLAEFKPPVYDKSGVRLITSSLRRPAPDVLDPRIHHANLIQSILAKIEANHAGVDDALMLDGRGFVAETNATHVFVVRDGTVVTTRLVACPEGVTRATVLELCAAHGIPALETDLPLAAVYSAAEMFCTGTMGELAPVVEVDGRKIGGPHTDSPHTDGPHTDGPHTDGPHTDGGGGPVTRRLSALYAELTASTGEEILGDA